jgi:hypothetical protein
VYLPEIERLHLRTEIQGLRLRGGGVRERTCGEGGEETLGDLNGSARCHINVDQELRKYGHSFNSSCGPCILNPPLTVHSTHREQRCMALRVESARSDDKRESRG